jgi:hypothetical protein
MTNRDYLAFSCIAAGIFWIAFYLLGSSGGSFGILSLVLAAGNAIVVASIYGAIKPWRRQIMNLALADAIGIVVILFGTGSYVSNKLASGGASSFALKELGIGALLLALAALLAAKGWLTWKYARDLKAAGIPQSSGKLPAILQIIGGALIALFAGGCTFMIGGFNVRPTELPIVFIFGWLPLIAGLITLVVGARKLSQS